MEIFDEDVFDSTSINSKIFNSYYPNGQQIIKNTSQYSPEFGSGMSRERTMTSRTLAGALNLDTLYQNPKFPYTFLSNSLNSSLNSVLSGGGAIAFTSHDKYKTQNPEDPDSTTTLTGGTAFTRIISDTILGKQGGQGLTQASVRNIENLHSVAKSFPTVSTGHSDSTSTGFIPDGSNPSSGSRIIALDVNMSPDEKTWLLERANLLKSYKIASDAGLVNGFNFDTTNGLVDLTTTNSYYPGVNNSSNKLPQGLIDAAVQKAYVCPALIELLIYLNSKIYIKGGFGLDRANNPSKQGSNLAPIASGQNFTDHALGRGFDVTEIGTRDGSKKIVFSTDGSDSTKYKEALDILLTAFAAAPGMHLLPDLIGVSSGLATSLGIGEGLEAETTVIKKQYPCTKYINFSADDSHINHLHMSFAAGRSGVYGGPGGQLGGIAEPSPQSSGGRESDSSGGSTTSPPPQSSGGREGAGQNSTEPSPQSAGGREGASVDGATSTADTTSTVLNNTFTPNSKFHLFRYILRSNNPLNPYKFGQTPGTGADGISVGGTFVIPSDLNSPNFTKNYRNSAEKLTVEEVYAMCRLTVAYDEVAAIFSAISRRESGGCPGAVLISRRSGDYSFGLWGMNMSTSANGKKEFTIPYPSEKRAFGWALGYKDHARDGINASNFNYSAWDKATALGGKEKYSAVFDPAVWVPINQAYIMYTVAVSKAFSGEKMGAQPESGYVFFAWGDYGGGPPYGFISNVRYSTVKNLYVSSGGSASDLKEWVLEMFRNSNSDSKPYAENWTNGWHYPVAWGNGGWVKESPIPPGSSNDNGN